MDTVSDSVQDMVSMFQQHVPTEAVVVDLTDVVRDQGKTDKEYKARMVEIAERKMELEVALLKQRSLNAALRRIDADIAGAMTMQREKDIAHTDESKEELRGLRAKRAAISDALHKLVLSL